MTDVTADTFTTGMLDITSSELLPLDPWVLQLQILSLQQWLYE